MSFRSTFTASFSKSSIQLGTGVSLPAQCHDWQRKHSQQSYSPNLLQSLINYLGCGNYLKKKDIGNFIVTKFSDNYDKIIPLFKTYPLLGEKIKDYIA